MATTLIRLREKLELQLCTVFHSARYPIILTRNAYQTQDDARSRFRSSRLHTITRQKLHKVEHAIQRIQDRTQPRSAILHKLYNEHIFRKLIQKTQLRHNMKRGKLTIFVNWKKTFWTNKLECCVLESERTLRVLQREKDEKNERWRWGGGG